jgi:hypothetical protein
MMILSMRVAKQKVRVWAKTQVFLPHSLYIRQRSTPTPSTKQETSADLERLSQPKTV